MRNKAKNLYKKIWWKLAPASVKERFASMKRTIEYREQDIRDLTKTIDDLERGYKLLSAWYKAETKMGAKRR